MKRILFAAVAALSFCVAGVAFAKNNSETYADVPADNAQYAACIQKSMKKYDGGDKKSKVDGKTMAQAWCTCMWNKAPEEAKSDLVKFANGSSGADANKTCEKYSGWK